ncbi:hypothetical protein ACFJGV_14620 [Cnuibacter sp. UC19_7]|uniref:hypothetical protein n=1 Tax=Cnuibacter sp. UC19_7 TaxID=3350166 RepID=UPI00366BF11E
MRASAARGAAGAIVLACVIGGVAPAAFADEIGASAPAAPTQAADAPLDPVAEPALPPTPVLTGPASGSEVTPGTLITGTGRPYTLLTVRVDARDPYQLTVDGNGVWSLPARADLGPVTYRIAALDGTVEGEPLTLSYEVVAGQLPDLAPWWPQPNQRALGWVTAISGTGTPGATVHLTGDVEGTTFIGLTGAWTVPCNLTYGAYQVTMTQTAEGLGDSRPVTVPFTVVPFEPVIAWPDSEGIVVQAGTAPVVSGSVGVPGSTVVVSWGEGTSIQTIADPYRWSVTLPSDLPVGGYTIFAWTVINGQSSDARATGLTVVPAPPSPPVETPTGTGSNAAVAGSGGSGTGTLAQTGLDAGPLALSALAMVALAAGMMTVARRLRRGGSI